MIENLIVQKAVIRHPESNSYLILRRSKTDVKRPGDWDLPGGKLDPGETLEEGVLRELDEEIDKKPTGLVLRFTQTLILAEPGQNYIQMIYSGDVDDKTIKLSSEHDYAEWVTKNEMLNRFKHLERYHQAISHIFDNQLDKL